METVFFYEDGKIASFHRYVHCPPFELFARALKRTDHYLPDKPASNRMGNSSIVSDIHNAPFEVSKHKGSFKFRLCSHDYSHTITEEQVRLSVNRSNLSAPVSEDQIQKYISDYAYVELEERAPNGQRLFVHFRPLGRSKTNWAASFANNMIYVAKTKNAPGVVE